MQKSNLLLIGICLSFPGLVFAEETTSTVSNLKFSGYLDGSYNYLLNSNQFISGTNNRVYDLEPNGFTLQQGAITVAYQPPQGLGGLLNIVGGRDASTIASYGFKPTSEFDSQTFAFDLTQAYLQYAVNKFTFIGGKFVTIVGAEVFDPTQDTNFSRAILDGYAEPTTLTGLRGTYAANDKINVFLGINNGWDNIRDWSRNKTIELGTSVTVNSVLSFSATGYTGQERATPATDFGPEGIRNLIDLVATINATEKLTFVANYDYGWQTNAALPAGNFAEAVWTGIAGYANYKFTDKWQTSLRGEIFDDRNGYRTGVPQCWKEATLSVGYTPIKNLELRAEIRHDYSNVASFIDKNGVNTSHNQQSYALEGLYKFG